MTDEEILKLQEENKRLTGLISSILDRVTEGQMSNTNYALRDILSVIDALESHRETRLIEEVNQGEKAWLKQQIKEVEEAYKELLDKSNTVSASELINPDKILINWRSRLNHRLLVLSV